MVNLAILPLSVPTYSFLSGPNTATVGASKSISLPESKFIGDVAIYVKVSGVEMPSGVRTVTETGIPIAIGGDLTMIIFGLTT